MLDTGAETKTRAETKGAPFSASEELLTAALKDLIREGALVVDFASGRERRFGQASAEAVRVSLKDASAARRLMANAELALGELYTDGLLSVDCDNVDGLLAVILQNLRERGFRTRAAPAGMRP